MTARTCAALVLCLAPAPVAQSAAAPAARPLRGSVDAGVYSAATGAFRIPVPVMASLGGSVSDTTYVVTFEDDFSTHISIAAFPQDIHQRRELAARGLKEYLVYFFRDIVLPDFLRQFPKTGVESARFIPQVHDGALLSYTLIPGGTMFAGRAAIPGTDPATLTAKRGTLLFLKNDHVFVISMELAEFVLERTTTRRTTAEDDDLLRQRLLSLAAKLEFPPPPASGKR